jgi:hypothetical protein
MECKKARTTLPQANRVALGYEDRNSIAASTSSSQVTSRNQTIDALLLTRPAIRFDIPTILLKEWSIALGKSLSKLRSASNALDGTTAVRRHILLFKYVLARPRSVFDQGIKMFCQRLREWYDNSKSMYVLGTKTDATDSV